MALLWLGQWKKTIVTYTFVLLVFSILISFGQPVCSPSAPSITFAKCLGRDSKHNTGRETNVLLPWWSVSKMAVITRTMSRLISAKWIHRGIYYSIMDAACLSFSAPVCLLRMTQPAKVTPHSTDYRLEDRLCMELVFHSRPRTCLICSAQWWLLTVMFY